MVLPLGVIWAQGNEGALGQGGRLPWHLPEDMAMFKALTLGHTVVMGRVTWEGLPPRFRPLPGRHNIVLSRHPKSIDAEGADVMSLEDFIRAMADEAIAPGEAAAAIPPSSATPARGADTPADPAHTFMQHIPRDLVWVLGGAQIYAALLPFASWAAITSIDVSVPGADAFAARLPESFRLREAIPASSWAHSRSGLPYRFALYSNDQPRPLPTSERGNA